MKKRNSKSWVVDMKRILQEYNLPSIHQLLTDTPTKESWKKSVKQAIVAETTTCLRDEALDLSTLVHLNPAFRNKSCHPSLAAVDNPRQVNRAVIKARMLTGTYFPYRPRGRADICGMCKDTQEDIAHILLHCPGATQVRDKYLPHILDSIPTIDINHQSHIVQAILDITHPSIAIANQHQHQLEYIEKLTRDYCYAVHNLRCSILNQN